MKSVARSSNDSTTSIVADQLQHVEIEAQGSFPKLSSMQRVVQRSRASSNHITLSATSRADLPVMKGLFKTPTQEDFLKFDSGADQDRILIFSTDANFESLKNCDHWFADGTFRSSPLLFPQLFVIHGLKQDGVNVLCLPLAYCLTPNRTTATYKRVFGQLKKLHPGLAPISIMSDFEQASRNAWSHCFPHVEQRGCFFHFRQANYRRIRSKSLTFTLFELPF